MRPQHCKTTPSIANKNDTCLQSQVEAKGSEAQGDSWEQRIQGQSGLQKTMSKWINKDNMRPCLDQSINQNKNSMTEL